MYYARAILLVTLLYGCASLGFGQKLCRINRPSYRHTALVSTRYDRSARRMKTVLEYPAFDASKGGEFTILASFFHHDLKVGGTPSVNLTFVFASAQSSSQHARDLSLNLNGRPWAFIGPVQYSSYKEGHAVVDAASVTLSYEKLMEVINARKAEVRLGGTERRLSGDNIEALRELASQLAPYQQWQAQGPWTNALMGK